jgi:tartrate/fumarate subfamily iron-sulfur-dependent hydro-lyase alpha chain
LIKRTLYEKIFYETIRKATTTISKDVRKAFENAVATETSPRSKKGFETTLDSLNLSVQRDNVACPDTGWPLFYFKIGNDCELEGGILALEDTARNAVVKCTTDGYLRATMKHPVTGYDPGNNIGMNVPYFTYKFIPGTDFEVTFCAKGGGSECFGGTRQQVIAYADGVKAIEKCIIDWYVDGTKQGAVCPPSILGIGIGGTANISANLAKEAALLRTIGSQHPDPMFSKIENDLYNALNYLGVGIMGVGGKISVFAVNVEYAFTHLDGIIISMASNCMVARRATHKIKEDSTVEVLEKPNWFEGR